MKKSVLVSIAVLCAALVSGCTGYMRAVHHMSGELLGAMEEKPTSSDASARLVVLPKATTQAQFRDSVVSCANELGYLVTVAPVTSTAPETITLARNDSKTTVSLTLVLLGDGKTVSVSSNVKGDAKPGSAEATAVRFEQSLKSKYQLIKS